MIPRQAGALVLLVALLAACRPTRPPESPGEIYSVYCARCHGDDGRGVERQLRRYPKADLGRSEMLARGDRAAVLERTAKGYGPMPAFASKLTAAELEKVTDFVFALGLGGSSAGGAGPRESDEAPPGVAAGAN